MKAVPRQRINQLKPDTQILSPPVSECSKHGHMTLGWPMESEVKFSKTAGKDSPLLTKTRKFCALLLPSCLGHHFRT